MRVERTKREAAERVWEAKEERRVKVGRRWRVRSPPASPG